LKVFISWSGDRSKAIAAAFKEWLPSVIQAVRPYFSPNDIDKGARWSSEISKELESASVGLICLTRENLTASWLMFEAGALSKSLDKSRVCPMLFGIEPSDMSGPLVQFQATSFSKEEVLKLLRTVNQQLDSTALEAKTLENVFEKWWPDLNSKITSILDDSPSAKDANLRTEREILEEVLQLTRSINSKTRTAQVQDGNLRHRNLASREMIVVMKAYLMHIKMLVQNANSSEEISSFLELAVPLADLLLTAQGEVISRTTSSAISNVLVELQKKQQELDEEIPF
jgi:hypothetical protein